MKKSDNKTEAQPEEVKPEEIKAEKKKPASKKPTAKKPQTANPEEVKSEEVTPVEEVKPVEEVQTEAPAEQPAEEVKAEEVKSEETKAEEKGGKKSFFSSRRNVAIVACAGAAVVALSLGLGLGLGLKKDDGKEPVEPPAKTAFSAPTGVAVNESTISWTAVDNATSGYTLKFAESNKEMTLMVVTYDLLSDTTYLAEGKNTLSVKVNATDTHLASVYSATVTYTYTVTTPVGEKFNAPTGLNVNDKTLSWTAVSGATSYTVKINDDETTTVNTNSLDLTTVTDKLVEGKNTISVKVNAAGDKKASDYSTPYEYNYTAPAKEEKFDAPAGLTVTDKTLSWTAVDGAASYTVKINDETTTVNTNSLDLTTVTDKLVEGKNTISVKVNAAGDKKASDYSSTVEYTYVDEDKEAAKTFDGLVAGLDITANDAAEKLAAAKTAYNALSSKAKELAATSVAKLKEEDGKYFVALVDKIGTVTEDSGAVISTAVNYYATLLDNTAATVVTAKATLDTKNSEYQHFYESFVAEFGEKVNAITIADDSRGAVINTVKTAIETAETYYNGLTEKVQAALAELKITLDNKKASYAKAVKAELDGYKALVDEALAIIEDESKLDDLTAKKTAISEYVLSDVNEAAVEADAELITNINSIDTAITNWNTAIANAVTELTVIATDDDEADIVSATEALAGFDDYADYIKADDGVKAAKEATEAVLAAATGRIERAVNAVKTTVEGKIDETAELIEDIQPGQENYDALEAQKAVLESQKAAIEEIDGAYATHYLATLTIGEDSLAEAVKKAIATVEDAKETMLATVVRTEGGEAYSLSGTTLKITLFKTFYNFRDEKITATEGENAPKLTTTGTNTNGDTIVTVEQQFTANEINEYVAIIQIEQLGELNQRKEDAAYTIKVGGSEETKALKFGATLGYNPYFSNDDEVIDEEATGFKKAVFNGNFVMNFQGDCTAEKYYLEVYNADALTIYGPENAYVKFSEMPLGKIDVTGIKQKYMDENKPFSMADFNRLLANELSDVFVDKTVTVRFMLYGKTVTDEVPAFTAMNASVISEAIDFNLVEEDKYYTLPVANLFETIETVVDKDVMYLVVESLKSSIIDFVNDSLTDAEVTGVTLTEDNYTEYLRLKIELYNANDSKKPVLYTKYLDNIAFKAINVEDIIEQWQREYFEEHGNVEDPEYKIGIRIAYNAKENTAITKYFPRAEFKETQMNGETYVRDIVLSKAAYVVPNTGMNKSGTDYFEFLRDSVGNGKILLDNDADYLEIKFYQTDGEGKEIKVNYAYLFDVDGTAVIYQNKEDVGKEDTEDVKIAKLAVGDTTNAYTTINNFKENFAEKYYTVDGYPLRWDDGWTFTARYERNTDPEHETEYLFDGDWSEKIEFERKSSNMPTHVQIGVASNDSNYITFIRKPDGGQDGTVFTGGGTERINFYFYQGDTKSYDYCIFMKYNIEDKTVALYYNNGTEDVYLETCRAATDSYCMKGELITAMNTYLTAMHSEDNVTPVTADTLKDWTFVSKIIAREGSRVFVETEMESEGSWSYPAE